MTMRSVPFAARFTVASTAGRRAARVRSLGGTSDWRRDLLDRVGAGVVSAVGTGLLRSSPEPWRWPVLDARSLSRLLGLAEIMGAAAPRQVGRERLTLLARTSGGHEVVVKLGRLDDGLQQEAIALEQLTEYPLPAIATPRLLDRGSFDGADDGIIGYLVTEAIGLSRQRPAIDERLATFERDLAERLADVPRPVGITTDLVPVHGDLAPWNLRRTGRGLALFDWEASGWGVPGSDLAHYRRSCDLLRRRRDPGRTGAPETDAGNDGSIRRRR